jgi:hypothetical protein
MVAPYGTHIKTFVHELQNNVQHPPAVRAAIDIVPQHVKEVAMPEIQTSEESAKSFTAAMYIAYCVAGHDPLHIRLLD